MTSVFSVAAFQGVADNPVFRMAKRSYKHFTADVRGATRISRADIQSTTISGYLLGHCERASEFSSDFVADLLSSRPPTAERTFMFKLMLPALTSPYAVAFMNSEFHQHAQDFPKR